MKRIAAAAILLSNACYLSHAAAGQAQILWRRQPVEDVIKDPSTDEKTRARLQHVLSVRKWAGEHLGLSNDAFRRFTRLDRKAVAWNVTASRELAFIPKTWWFPVVGTVPYLGFFKEDMAEKQAQELRSEGWDVLVQEVAGYSTLGWFEDPLLSPQLEYPEWYLTRLVIHESTHATVWIPGSVDFNESFAGFVEIEGALEYARQTEGPDSESYKRKIALLKESSKIRELFHRTATALESVYASDSSEEIKRAAKQNTIESFKEELRQRRGEFTSLRVDAYLERGYNNADFLSARRYESGEEWFRSRFEACGRQWKCFLDNMKALKSEPPGWKKSL